MSLDHMTFHAWMCICGFTISDKVDQEHKIISKHSNAVGGWHDNDEGKDIINEGVEGLEKDIPVIHDQHLYVQALNFITLTCTYVR